MWGQGRNLKFEEVTLVEKELLGNFEGFRWSVVGVGVALLETVGDVIACVLAELCF